MRDTFLSFGVWWNQVPKFIPEANITSENSLFVNNSLVSN